MCEGINCLVCVASVFGLGFSVKRLKLRVDSARWIVKDVVFLLVQTVWET